jgi:hypothetical protein
MLETIIASILLVILGVLLLFSGYMFFRILLPIWGFVTGFILGAGAVSALVGGGFLGTLASWIIGLLFGILLAVLSYAIYSLGVALLGASVGAWLMGALLLALGVSPSGFIFTLLVIAMAIFFGIGAIALRVQKFLIILLTSIGGANALILSVLLLFGQVTLVGMQIGDPMRNVLQDSFFWLTIWVILTAFGAFVQTVSTKAVELDTENYDIPGMEPSNK